MPVTFTHTLRALDADRSRRRIGPPLIAAVLLAWTTWFLLGRVAVYEVTDRARLEVKAAAHPLAAPVDGRVLETRLTIGREVREGEVLVALDADAQRLAIEEQRARLCALAARRESLGKEIRAEQEALTAREKGRAEARAEARALVLEAEARMRAAEFQAQASERLSRRDAVSRETLLKDQAEAEARRAQARALTLATARGEQDRLIQESDRRTELAGLERMQAEIEGEMAIAAAAIRTLEHEVERRRVRAPVSGRVGESAEVRPGTVVRAGQRLGAVVPPGRPRVVAHFPVAAVERIRPGQPAWVRLEGFPWTQYGALAAAVADAGNEPSAGLIRVELTLAPGRATSIPLAHGLPGSAEVEVERVSPAVLVLRAAGQYLAAGPASPRHQDDRSLP
jgi:membrane fusion protein (multidrug efflux system)